MKYLDKLKKQAPRQVSGRRETLPKIEFIIRCLPDGFPVRDLLLRIIRTIFYEFRFWDHVPACRIPGVGLPDIRRFLDSLGY